MKKNDFSESLAFILIFGLGFFTFVRGFFWFIEQNAVIHDSDFYSKLHEIMPIWLWGLLVMIASFKLILSAFFIPSEKLNNVCNWLLLFGGGTTSIMYFLMTSASIFNAINWLTWVQFAVLTVVCGAVAFVGGATLYARRK
ncbi:hypothetical protein [Staphylococcus chromogenes]|uniref:hypothetical protein n=1 Tax=Staphylococcus chromogenes TaxID=46126 RepID=UPI0028874E92|nr:hypothetical protein [Staphylococcus chromogenes]MDT0670677.1 hypothetical protein [Staphylococcus chromogenes]